MKTLSRIFLFSLGLLLLVDVNYSQSKMPFSFPQTASINKPWTYWWWLGSAVDSQNITYNLEKFAEAGIGGVHIIPVYGVKGYEEKFIDFLSPKWMKMLAYTSKECERLGIGLDMTLGTGWPFGGPHVPVKYSSSQMIDVLFDVKNKSEVRLNIIEEVKKKKDENCEMNILSVNAYLKNGRADLTKNVDEKGLLVWNSPGDSCKIIALVLASPIQQVKRAAPGGKGNVVDPFSAEAVNDYLASFDKAFENYNGKIPEAFYQDSYEYFGADWTINFLDEFKNRRGYNLLDEMPALLGYGDNEIVSRVKSDYRFTISQLHEEFIKNVSAWTNKKGAAFRDQAHGAPGNLLDIYAAADIPETEVFGTPRLSISGLTRDTLFMREEFVDPLILKFASSAAHTTGRNLISSETGTWIAEHFRESLSQLKPEIDLLFLSGVNHIFFHGIPYSPKEEEWPGWQFYASTNYGPTNSFWYDIPYFNNYIARCQSVLQEGKPDNNLLVYFPIWDIWHSPKERLINLRIHNPEQWLFKTNFYETVKELAGKGFSFDYISDEQIEKSKVVDGEILAGLNKYKSIVIPPLKFMPVQTLRKLNEFLKNGGKIIFMDKLPEDVPGFYKNEEQRFELKKIAADIIEETNSKKVFIGCGFELMLKSTGVTAESFADFNIDFIRRKADDGRYYFLANQQAESFNDWVKLVYPAESVVVFDPLNNKSGLAKLKKNSDGSTSVYLQIESGASLILKCLDKKTNGEQWVYLKPLDNSYEIRGEWKVDFIQGGPALPGSVKINKLESWTQFGDDEAKRFAGTAKYKIKFQNPDPRIKNWILDLGKVCESARIKINNQDFGALWSVPFKMSIGDVLNKGENELEIEVTNLSANRIKDLDERKVNWKKFYDINFVNMRYKKFDASTWSLVDSGLLGPVRLYPAEEIK
jgi:hypothetical protein